jgi:hypothetical protein
MEKLPQLTGSGSIVSVKDMMDTSDIDFQDEVFHP